MRTNREQTETLLALINGRTESGSDASAAISQEACAHALLEIGEQLRVANLISLLQLATGKKINQAWITQAGLGLFDLKPGETDSGLQPDIIAALGLD